MCQQNQMTRSQARATMRLAADCAASGLCVGRAAQRECSRELCAKEVSALRAGVLAGSAIRDQPMSPRLEATLAIAVADGDLYDCIHTSGGQTRPPHSSPHQPTDPVGPSMIARRDAAVHQRHPDIEQDPLPFDVEPAKAPEPNQRRPRVNTMEHGECPVCEQTVALTGTEDTGRAVAPHYRVTIGTRFLLCGGSGQPPAQGSHNRTGTARSAAILDPPALADPSAVVGPVARPRCRR